MNEVKVSTKTNGNKSHLTIKLDIAALGLAWDKGDIVRVKSYKKDGRIILKTVGKKVKKTVCHTLTATGGNATTHALGFKLNYRKNRFKGPLAENKNSIPVAVRYTNQKMNELEIFLPREVFAS